MSDDPTIIKLAHTPEDQRIVLASHERRLQAVEELVAENNRTLRPVRLVVNKLSAALSTAAAAAILAELTGVTDLL